ncbi:lipase family protein [Mycobacterium noviomagense]|uniref:Lipase n=1 Tax=Mycobacterium noviomagense TaxID=459858 RepID=A0A7I7PK47_9MYCO|nr:lipase family protein [Mycobacterium noviomagense]ORB16302.1 lipase [Mycobacterium noviomagense]BBY08900.1 lipase [Mycobacterium noviomagense]
MDPGGLTADVQWLGRAPHQDARRGEHPLLPSRDPFYTPPSGYEQALPGTVLRSRGVELAFLGLIPQRFRATQLLYRSTDLNGEPEAAVTTVVVPAKRDPELVCPMVSYQCAIDAVAERCFPSYALRRGSKAVGALAQIEFLLIAAVLAEGWAVSVPDHEGCHGMWGAPYEPGYRILDGVRAALNCQRLGLSPSAPVGLWGYSGGGFASAWAAEVCAGYAPELNIVGAVLGSPVGDPGSVGRRLNATFWAGLPAMVIGALAQIYPDVERLVQEHATDEGKAILAKLQKMTTAAAVLGLKNKDINDYMDLTLDELWDLPEVQHIMDAIKLGTAAPTAPVLIIQAANDKIINVADIDALAAAYRAGGASVTYHRDCFSEHLSLHALSAPMALRWLRDRFAGRPLTEHLTRTTWPTLLNPSTYWGMIQLGAITAKVITGRRVRRRPLSKFDSG